MPTYEFRCADCGHRFSQFYRTIAVAQEAPAPACPRCESERTRRVPSSFAVSGPSAPDPGQIAHDQAQANRAASVTPRDQIESWRKDKPSS
jgi:putative FmdB family regulatory protein